MALLERLEGAADPQGSGRSSSRRDDDVEASVRAHLAQVLNTRQGSCLTCPDYGLIEVSEVLYDFPDAVGVVTRALKNTIQLYEPRLKNLAVRHVKNEGAHEMLLQFEISGQVQLSDGRRSSLRLSTAVDASGNVKVEG